MSTTLTDPLIGRLVDSRYQVVRRIARGGMATVYLARDRRLDRDVALKVMHPHLAEGSSGEEFVARFRREARAAARLAHPGLVGIFDQGVDGETSYLTMEYVDGTNLRRLLNEGPLSVEEALATTESILEALTAAHRADLVHRDIKPENVLISSMNQVKVADFGLARAVTEVTSTATGTVLGTVAYLAPELVTSGASDTRTDIYAVGILLFEMLTGAQPFTGATPIQVAYQHVHADLPAPSDKVSWLPTELDDLVLALSARDPEDRPADAHAALELVRHTHAQLDSETLSRRANRPVTVAPAPLDPRDDAADSDATTQFSRGGAPSRTVALPIGDAFTEPTRPRATQIPRHKLVRWLAIAFIALLALGATGWWYMAAGPGAWTRVPTGLVGAPLADAERILSEQGLDVGEVTQVFDPQIPLGSVVAPTPAEGDAVRKDGVVDLAVSKGPDLRTVPEGLAGKPVEEVQAALTDAGFTLADPKSGFSDTVPAQHVLGIATTDGPAEDGAQLPAGTPIVITVSDGPAPVTVDSVLSQKADAAKAHLEELGLRVTVEQDYSMEYEAGTVMAQSLEPGAEAHRTDPITITVSQGPPLAEVPNVMRNGVQAAQQTLEEAGFVVEVQRASPFFGLGFVVDQSVKGGDQAPLGSTITITIT